MKKMKLSATERVFGVGMISSVKNIERGQRLQKRFVRNA
jgi:hypothetical protein